MNLNLALDSLWIILCAFLVFMMQFGFAMVETGCARSKNTINVAMKNLADSTFGFFFYWIIGFGLMFGLDKGGFIGTTHFMIDGHDPSLTGFFFFQAMFATTAATIVSGAVAERMKFNGYVLSSIAVTAVIYPLFGHWAWGDGGWLKNMGFIDFAGSTVVHSVGAWIGLAGAIVLGPRIGRFRSGRPNYFAPSNHNVIVFGALMLWFAWFGFNAGSLLSFGPQVSSILLNTLLSGATGGIGAYLISLVLYGKVGVEHFSFGIIAGLVGITAGCAEFTAPAAAIIGLISALIMFICEWLLLKIMIDDPLSVVSIHGCVGAWGTIAVGMFAPLPQSVTRLDFIKVQFIGILAAFALAFSLGILFFSILKVCKTLRVRKKHEVLGLNVTEHGAKLPWVETIESIIRIMRSGQFNNKIHEERGTEVGIVARFFNYLLGILSERQKELVSSNLNLRSQAQVDPLTKILNRRGLMERIKQKTSLNKDFSIIIVDIDHFKKVNDNYGHTVGDTVLKEISQLFTRKIRSSDTVARWGGEEFILLVDSVELDMANEIAEKLREAVEDHQFTDAGKITCSFGVCSPKRPQTPFENLLHQADKALYRAKDGGRNQVCYD
jgi:Amt family ammonium transporter